MKILKKTLTGLGLLAVLLGFIFLTSLWDGKGQYFFDALLIIVMAFSTYEMITAFRKKGYNPEVIPLCIMVAAAYPLVIFFGYTGLFVLLGAGLILILCFYVFDQKVTLNDMLVTLLIMLYPLASIVLAIVMTNLYGMLPLLTAIGGAMMADTIAYYFGSMIKGPKIFPKVSPNKTWSGSLFGILGGVGGTLLIYALFEVAGFPINSVVVFGQMFNPYLFYSLIGVAFAIVGEIGDLVASRIKRSLELKDFSNLLGSHGGLMDRLDSIIFAIVFMAIVLAFIA